jgi:Flp pilus assembly pilin Flp
MIRNLRRRLGGVVAKVLAEYLRDETGTTVLEYAWIASLIGIVCVPAFYAVRNKMQTMFWPAINNLAS